jgi:glutamate-ammonia-ligase adenylyltransferase
LTRLRFVAGERFLGEYVSALVSSWVYDAPLPAGWGEKIVAMRRAMETRTRAHRIHSIDLKLGPGGMADVEFIVQMIQLGYGGSRPEIRGRKVGALLTQGWFPPGFPGDPAFLASAYAMYRRLEILLRIGLEERGWVLPEGEKLRRLALLYDGSPGASLESRLISTMKRVREEFLEIAAFLERAHPGVPREGGKGRHD